MTDSWRAAYDYAKQFYLLGTVFPESYARDGFLAGIEWQREQSASADIEEAYKRGLKTAIEILGAEMTAQGYHGPLAADVTMLDLQTRFQDEIDEPTASRMRGWG